MGALTDYAQTKINDALRRGQPLGAPATMYFTVLTCTKGARANSTAYALNDTVAILANDGKYHLYKVTTAGTTAAAQSTLYPGTANEVITDGTAVLTEQNNALDAGTAMVEPSGGGFARVGVTASLANWTAAGTNGQSSNAGTITFPVPSADWTAGTVRAWAWAWFDSLSGGNAWEWGPLSALQAITNGQQAPSFAGNALVVGIGN
jgi:hypothetical protein